MPGTAKPFATGNPTGGRPKKSAAARAAEAWALSMTGDPSIDGENRPLAILKQLYSDALDPLGKASERTAAAREWFDRVVGKAPQAITGADGEALIPPIDLSRLTDEQLAAIVAIGRAVVAESGDANGGSDADSSAPGGESPP